MTQPKTPRVRRSWVERTFDDQGRGLDRFGLLLFLTIVSVVGLALVEVNGPNTSEHSINKDIGSLGSAVVVGLTLVVALRASGLNHRRQAWVDVMVGLVVVGYVASLFGSRTPAGQPAPGVSGVLVVLTIVAPIVVVLRLVRHRDITLATILGAISAYLLIAVAFFYIFLTLGAAQGSFFGQEQPSMTYMYFSLSTITTVGYGDFTAMTPLGRLLANSEAVIGQVYLVTFVAFIVSLGASGWRTRRDEAIAADAADED